MPGVLVIGAGASGLAAAVTAAKRGLSVTVVEAEDRPAKKLLRTGNGRCNFTHENVTAIAYRSSSPEIARKIIASFGTDQAVAFFEEIGVIPWQKDGYYYPLTGQAASVTDCLLAEARRLGVRILTNSPVQDIRKENGAFAVQTAYGLEKAPYLVISAGTPAGLRAVSWKTGEKLSGLFGLKQTPLLPALTALVTEGFGKKNLKAWNGVRVKGKVSLYEGEKKELLASDSGEIQLTDYGISGIPVFQVSAAAAELLQKGKSVRAELSFFPEQTEQALGKMLWERRLRRPELNAGELLCGMLNAKLIRLFASLCGIDCDRPLSRRDCDRLARLLSALSLPVDRVKGIEDAQVCAGGILLDQVDPRTMECRTVPGLYLTGELLDAAGICGGYNLHWAWATGIKAGKSIPVPGD